MWTGDPVPTRWWLVALSSLLAFACVYVVLRDAGPPAVSQFTWLEMAMAAAQELLAG